MSAYSLSESMLGRNLALFGATEVFIYVFMEIVSKLDPIHRRSHGIHGSLDPGEPHETWY